MKIFHVLTCLTVFSLLLSCEPNNKTDACIFPECTGVNLGYQEQFDTATPHYYFPAFNPNNPDEFAYIKWNVNSGAESWQMIKYNMATQESEVLMEGLGLFPNDGSGIKWGRSNHILYNSNSQIFKLNVADKIVTQITNTNSNYSPGWNYNGDRIIYNKDIGGTNLRLVSMDINGNNIDTADFPIPMNEYNALGLPNGHYLCTSQYEYLYEYDENLNHIQTIDINGQQTGLTPTGMDWIPGSNKVIIAGTGDGYGNIYIVDYIAHSKTTLFTQCAPTFRKYVSVSPSGDKMLVSIVKSEVIGNCLYKVKYEMHLMDIDGSNDQTINLP